MNQIYHDQLNPIYISYKYHDWYRNGMNTQIPCPDLPIGFRAWWKHDVLRKLRTSDGLTVHLAII